MSPRWQPKPEALFGALTCSQLSYRYYNIRKWGGNEKVIIYYHNNNNFDRQMARVETAREGLDSALGNRRAKVDVGRMYVWGPQGWTVIRLIPREKRLGKQRQLAWKVFHSVAMGPITCWQERGDEIRQMKMMNWNAGEWIYTNGLIRKASSTGRARLRNLVTWLVSEGKSIYDTAGVRWGHRNT